MIQPQGYTTMLETTLEARTAALGATRQMIGSDQFEALTALLVAAEAIPAITMADALDALADKLIAKARGEMESEYAIYPSEIFDRVRELSAQAARLRGVVMRRPAPGADKFRGAARAAELL